MIKMSGAVDVDKPLLSRILGRITTDSMTPAPLRARRLLLLTSGSAPMDSNGFQAVLTVGELDVRCTCPVIQLPEWAAYLTEGDVVSVSTYRNLHVLFRVGTRANAFLVTERCSSNCIMCSQPPKSKSDSWVYDLAIEAIEHIPDKAVEISVTGGEPLLDAPRFLALLHRMKTLLPQTSTHVLSNGRLLAYIRYAQAIAEIKHRDLMFGIPLYSADPSRHDFVVQAEHAFDQTIRGILNAKRVGLRVEIRVVLHEQTAPGLHELSRFIARNLPYVDQVVLMGLEHIGYVKMNSAVLKAHPRDYGARIVHFVEELTAASIPVSIYNLPLCFVPERAWIHMRRSISEWKNDFPPACNSCSLQAECCGFFSWNVNEFADTVLPFNAEGRFAHQRAHR